MEAIARVLVRGAIETVFLCLVIAPRARFRAVTRAFMSTKASPRKRARVSPSSQSGSKASKIPRADGSPGTLGALFRKARTAPPSAERSKLAATAAEPEHEDPAALEDEDEEPVLSPATPAAGAPDASSVAAPVASLLLLPLPPLTEAEEKELKAFDLNMKWGPCAGISRISRWERANEFNLDPPARVMELLRGRENDKFNKSLLTCLGI